MLQHKRYHFPEAGVRKVSAAQIVEMNAWTL
jgi:hypothetical protein